jgi:hypothetical protein
MTEQEIEFALAIEPGAVTYVPGVATKRFAKDMAFAARNSPDKELTEKQRKYLIETVIRFRRQIPSGTVAKAYAMLCTAQSVG